MNEQRESRGKQIWRLIYPSLTYRGIGLLVGVVASIIISSQVILNYNSDLTQASLEKVQQETLDQYYAHYLEIQTATVVLTLPVLAVYYQWNRKRRLMAGFVEVLPDRSAIWMTIVAVFGAVTAYAGNGMISLSGLYSVTDSYDEVAAVFYQGKLILEIICLGVLTPVVEEIIFRGLMYTELTEIFNKKVAVLLAALIFGAYHGNLIQMVYGFLLGLLMIYVYERFRTLLAPILFHIGANILSVFLSETTALSFLYQTRGAMYVSVVVFSLLVIAIVWLIENRQRQAAN